MRKTMLGVLALSLVGFAAAARADGPVPPVYVGPVVIGGVEAEQMIRVLAHERHRRYRAGDPLDFLYPSPVPPSLAPGMPPLYVNGTLIVGREAEQMLTRLSRMRHQGRYRAGMSLAWLGLGVPMVVAPPPLMVPVAPVPMPVAAPPMPVAPVVMMAPPVAPVVVMAPPFNAAKPQTVSVLSGCAPTTTLPKVAAVA